MVPAKVVWLSDHTTTLPPSPRPVAEASIVVAASTLTVVAVGDREAFELGARVATSRVRIAAAPVAADQHLAAAGAAGGIDRGAGDLDVLAGHLDRAALACPCFLPAADSVPETLTVCVGAPAGLLPPVAALSTIMPLWRPIELASITPVVLMTELTTARAAAAVSSTRPPLALSVPLVLADQRIERLAGGDVDDLARRSGRRPRA